MSLQEQERIVALYLSGSGCSNIAKLLGVNPKKVWTILKRANVKLRPPSHRNPNRLPQDIVDTVLRLYTSGVNGQAIADDLGISDVSVYSILERRGIPRRVLNHPKETEIVNLLTAGTHPFHISKELNVKRYLIRRIALRHGFSYQQHGREIPFDNQYFDIIDTEEKAYWLGMLGADGFVASDGQTFGLTLGGITNPKDGKHVEQFKAALKSEHKVTYCKNNVVKLGIRNKHLVDALTAFGFSSDKSHTFNPAVDKILPELQRHFWRGMVDGDGCLYQDCRQTLPTWDIRMAGTRDVCDKFKNFCDLKSKVYLHDTESIWCINAGGRFQVRRVADLLYKDSTISLPRKYERYQQLILDCPLKFPNRSCEVDGCNGKYVARGLCRKHYLNSWGSNAVAWRTDKRPYNTWRQEVINARRKPSSDI